MAGLGRQITNNDYYKRSKMENIIALLKLTHVNNRLSKSQVEYIINTFCQEL